MAKAKRKAATKSKAKGKAKTKSRLKSKSKKISNKKPTRKMAKKTAKKVAKKTSKKAATKRKVKKPAKKATKSVKKTKKRAKPKLVKKGKTKAESEFTFTSDQKQDFLDTVSRIVDLHRSDKDGLKSLTRIERILDQYNQQYKDAHGKFDAIVRYGMEEDPSAKISHVFVPVEHKEKEVEDIYKLLAKIGKGKMQFEEAKGEIDNIYDQSVRARRG